MSPVGIPYLTRSMDKLLHEGRGAVGCHDLARIVRWGRLTVRNQCLAYVTRYGIQYIRITNSAPDEALVEHHRPAASC